MIDRTKRCYLYIRVSTDKQEEEGYSLPEQEDRLRAEAEKKGLEVIDIYTFRSTTQMVSGNRQHGLSVWNFWIRRRVRRSCVE